MPTHRAIPSKIARLPTLSTTQLRHGHVSVILIYQSLTFLGQITPLVVISPAPAWNPGISSQHPELWSIQSRHSSFYCHHPQLPQEKQRGWDDEATYLRATICSCQYFFGNWCIQTGFWDLKSCMRSSSWWFF